MTQSVREVKPMSSPIPEEPKTVSDRLVEQANGVLGFANEVSAQVALAINVLVGSPPQGPGEPAPTGASKGTLGEVALILEEITGRLNIIANETERLK